MMFAQALEGYWLEKRIQLSDNTIAEYSVTFRRFAEFVGDKPLADIGPNDVRAFLVQMQAAGLSGKTLSNIWTALSSFWTWAEVELGTSHAIRGRVRRPAYRTKPIEPYTEADIAAMLAACDRSAAWHGRVGKAATARRPTATRDRAIIVTLLDTGLRASELCALTVGDYDRAAGELRVQSGKGDKARSVWLGAAGQRALWRYLVARPDGDGAPLFSTSGGRHLDRNNLRQTLQRIGHRANVRGVTVHRFRHTFAIWFLRNGGNVLALQRLLGHEKMETVRIYARLAQVDLRTAQQTASPADRWRLG